MTISLPDKCPHDNDGDCVPGFVYVALINGDYKIGFTRDIVHMRLETLARDRRAPVQPELVFKTHCAPSMEKALHRIFADKRTTQLTGRKEYFKLDKEDLAAIGALTHYGGKELHSESVAMPDAINTTRNLLNKLRGG